MFREKIFKQALERYAGHHVANFIDQMDGKVGLGGFNVTITSYFQNLLAPSVNLDKIEPKILADFLQRYLDVTCEAVLSKKGAIDRLEAEMLRVFWGAPIEQKDHAALGISAAIEAVKKFNQPKHAYEHEEIDKFRISIGLSSGSAIVGNFGSKYRFNYTALGDAVKLASYIQSTTASFGVDVLISEFTYDAVKDFVATRELDLVQFPDLANPVRLYDLMGYQADLDDEGMRLIDLFQKGVGLFRSRHWDEAGDYFFEALKIDKNDKPSKLYIERCTHCKKKPPPKEWAGAVSFRSITR